MTRKALVKGFSAAELLSRFEWVRAGEEGAGPPSVISRAIALSASSVVVEAVDQEKLLCPGAEHAVRGRSECLCVKATRLRGPEMVHVEAIGKIDPNEARVHQRFLSARIPQREEFKGWERERASTERPEEMTPVEGGISRSSARGASR